MLKPTTGLATSRRMSGCAECITLRRRGSVSMLLDSEDVWNTRQRDSVVTEDGFARSWTLGQVRCLGQPPPSSLRR